MAQAVEHLLCKSEALILNRQKNCYHPEQPFFINISLISLVKIHTFLRPG
jgi:hypothetical protein